MPWLILIYTVPSEPSRKRAAVWRELKRVGAVYLRDGVCALPERAETAVALQAIAATIEGFDGRAILVEGAQLEDRHAQPIIDQSRAARAQEYAEVARDAEGLLGHVRRETQHRAFTYAELEELEADLGKLKRWYEQVRARDYFAASTAGQLEELLARCEVALGAFLEEAAGREEAT